MHGVIPSVAESHAYGIGARFYAVGHIVSVIYDSAAIIAHRRSQHLIAYRVAVDEQIIHSQPAYMQSGAAHRLSPGIKLSAQIARAQPAVAVLHIPWERGVIAYPTSTPIHLAAESLTPFGRFTPLRSALVGRHLHFPVAPFARTQFSAAVRYPHRFSGRHLARIPHIALSGGKILRRGGNEYVARFLHHIALIACYDPAEPRLLTLHVKRITQPLGEKVAHLYRTLSAYSGNQCNDSRSDTFCRHKHHLEAS